MHSNNLILVFQAIAGLALLLLAVLFKSYSHYFLVTGAIFLAFNVGVLLPKTLTMKGNDDSESKDEINLFADFRHTSCLSQDELARRIAHVVSKIDNNQEQAVFLLTRINEILTFSGHAGPTPDQSIDSDLEDAFAWFDQWDQPIGLDEIIGNDDEATKAVQRVMVALSATLVLPIHQNAELIGVVLISIDKLAGSKHPEAFWQLQVHATSILFNIQMRFESENDQGISEILSNASKAQLSLMPEEVLQKGKGWELHGLYRPVEDCGGDFWDWARLSDDKFVLVIGDATGHGAAPALLAAVTKGAFDAYVGIRGNACEPGRLLFALNKAVLHSGRRNVMMTAFALVVDTSIGEIRYANAGHNFPLYMRDGAIKALIARGDQLGVTETPIFRTHTKSIKPGDRMLVFTDGIIEAGQEHGKEFGMRRFRKLLQNSLDQPTDFINSFLMKSAREYTNTLESTIDDDVTLVTISFPDSGSSS